MDGQNSISRTDDILLQKMEERFLKHIQQQSAMIDGLLNVLTKVSGNNPDQINDNFNDVSLNTNGEL
jgi:hypothetical protein